MSQPTRKRPSQGPRKRPQTRSNSRLPWTRTAAVVTIPIAAVLLWAALARHFAPQSNTSRSQFDAIVVLGTPADSDGNPTPELLDRVTEAVREYRRGVAGHVILTGAAAHNRFVEAEAMAHVAESQGVPPSAIVEESHALDTIQNACYSARILNNRGWHSAEVISSAAHLPRAGMIFANLAAAHTGEFRIEWRTHAATADLTPGYVNRTATVVETLKTARYLVWSRWIETCEP